MQSTPEPPKPPPSPSTSTTTPTTTTTTTNIKLAEANHCRQEEQRRQLKQTSGANSSQHPELLQVGQAHQAIVADSERLASGGPSQEEHIAAVAVVAAAEQPESFSSSLKSSVSQSLEFSQPSDTRLDRQQSSALIAEKSISRQKLVVAFVDRPRSNLLHPPKKSLLISRGSYGKSR